MRAHFTAALVVCLAGCRVSTEDTPTPAATQQPVPPTPVPPTPPTPPPTDTDVPQAENTLFVLVGFGGDGPIEGAQLRDAASILGMTDVAGEVGVVLPPGDHALTVALPGLAEAALDVTIPSSGVVNTSVQLEPNATLTPDAVLEATDVNAYGVVPVTATSLTFQLVRGDGSLVELMELDALRARTATHTLVLDLLPSAQIVGTDVTIPTPGGLESLLSSFTGEVFVDLDGEDSAGGVYTGTTSFYIGRFALGGSLEAPPSAPDLPLGGVPIRGAVLGSNVVYDIQTDASGAFAVPDLPIGSLDLELSVEHDGQWYSAFGGVTILSDANILVRPLGVTDIIAGAVAIEVIP